MLQSSSKPPIMPIGGSSGCLGGHECMNSVRHRLAVWRAHLSIPTWLARGDENTVVSTISAINAGTVILTISALAWCLNMPLVFPALGPSAFILFASPFSRAAAPRSIVLGHGLGILCGWACWHLVSLLTGETVLPSMHGRALLLSASLALALTCVLLVRLSCPHAPACASALVVAVGGAGDWFTVFGMAAGVVIITAEAVVISRLAGVNVPFWSPRPKSGCGTLSLFDSLTD